MSRQVYKSKYLILKIDSIKGFMEAIRTPETKNQTEEEYKADSAEWRRILEENNSIEKLLIDGRDMRFIIAPELQEWINEHLIFPAVKIGLKKLAYLVPSEVFAQVSVEQTFDIAKDKALNIKYFDDRDKALAWLFAE